MIYNLITLVFNAAIAAVTILICAAGIAKN